MKPSRFSLLRVILLWIIILTCILATIAAGSIYLLPLRAEQTFGVPKTGYGPWQNAYLSLQLILFEEDLLTPLDPDGLPLQFEVKLGEPASVVAMRLQESGMINNPTAFVTYLRYKGLDTSIQAGVYTLSPTMNAVILAQSIQDATPTRVKFTILAGWRLEEIAAAIPTSGLQFSQGTFLNVTQRPPDGYSFSESIPASTPIEGFLYPDTYDLPRDIGAATFVRMCLDRFEQAITPDIRQGFNRQGLTIFDAVTLASIVEREAIDESEMPMIASVFLNRLRNGMKLDSDPTVQYAIGFNQLQNTWWTNPLSFQDLEVDSAYNTYKYPGLPPSPISNPSVLALQAVAFPAETPYFYFRATCDQSGRHTFSQTFDEHVQNACP